MACMPCTLYSSESQEAALGNTPVSTLILCYLAALLYAAAAAQRKTHELLQRQLLQYLIPVQHSISSARKGAAGTLPGLKHNQTHQADALVEALHCLACKNWHCRYCCSYVNMHVQ